MPAPSGLSLLRVILWSLVGVSTLLLGVVVLRGGGTMDPALGPTRTDEGMRLGVPFVLTDHRGQRFDSARDLTGKPHLVFFGFTHCPDICPTTLYRLSEALRSMPEQQDLRVLFVTVDPERDTPEVMASYIHPFDSRIIGLTGSQAEIDAVVAGYKAFAEKRPTSDGSYTMDHTALVYLFNRQGLLAGTLSPQEETPSILAGKLAKTLAE